MENAVQALKYFFPQNSLIIKPGNKSLVGNILTFWDKLRCPISSQTQTLYYYL